MFEKLKKLAEDVITEKPAAPILFTTEQIVVGTEYPSALKKKPREVFCRKLKPGTRISFKKYKYQGEPAFYVVDKGADFAVLPAPLSKYLDVMIRDLRITGYVSQIQPIKVVLEVRGMYRTEFPFYDGTPGPKAKEYHYRVPNPNDIYYAMPAEAEVLVNLQRNASGCYDIISGGLCIGTLPEEKTANLDRMLQKNKCTTTVTNRLNAYNCGLTMTLRF